LTDDDDTAAVAVPVTIPEGKDKGTSSNGLAHRYRGLIPQRSDEPGRNPTGRNQYTYRKAWEAEVERKLKGKVNGEISTVLEDIADELLMQARKGKPWAMREVLKRVWPEVQRHEHIDTAAPPQHSPLEALDDDDRATMLRLAQKAIRNSGKPK
jgi:hypothetical protein